MVPTQEDEGVWGMGGTGTMIIVYTFILVLCWVGVCLVGHGYANSIDQLSWWLHQHAAHVRGLHERRAAVVRERWVGELETGGQ